jgi:hypothetical protein
VVIDNSGSTVTLKAPLAVLRAASVTVTEKLYDPADPSGGVPLNAPALERFKNGGSPAADQVNGPIPPVDWHVTLTCVPSFARGRGEPVRIVSGPGFTCSVKETPVKFPALSCTLIVKL